MSEALAFYLAAVPAMLITGVAKGAFGVSMGIVAVPLLALTVPISQAAGILLPIIVAMDLYGVWVYRRTWDGGNLRRLLPGALVGIAAGALTFHAVPERAVRLLLGGIAVTFTLHHGVRRWLRPAGAGVAPHRLPGWAGLLAGTASGFTSFVAHSGAPPASIYLLPQRMEKTTLTGTTIVYFTALNLIKLPAYGALGLLAPGNLATSLVLGPLALGGVALGVALHRRLSAEVFYGLCYALVFLAGAKLLYDGAAPLWAGG